MSGYEFVVTKPFDNPHDGVKQKVGDHIKDQDAVAKILAGHYKTYGVKVATEPMPEPVKDKKLTPEPASDQPQLPYDKPNETPAKK